MPEEKDALLESYEANIGKETLPQPCVWPAELLTMQKVAWAAGDTNPLWWEEKYARKTCYGSIVASPAFLEWFVLRGAWPSRRDAALVCGVGLFGIDGTKGIRNVAGGKDCDYLRPIKPGDVLHLSHKLKSVKKRWSKSLNNNIYILNDELVVKNQYNQVVAIHRNTSVRIPEKSR
ncbi:MAG: MaoC family dehydratase N-terminal domain-containing protein [Chloroflexota bacterium]